MQHNRCKLIVHNRHVILILMVFAMAFICVSCNSASKDEATDKKVNETSTRFSSDFTSIFREKDDMIVTQEDISKIHSGMTLGEVVDIIGYPQRDIGSGRIILEWDIFDGQKLSIEIIKNLDSENVYDSVVS